MKRETGRSKDNRQNEGGKKAKQPTRRAKKQKQH